jgi:hypothetical protein
VKSHYGINGVLYYMAAAALLLGLIAITRRLVSAPLPHQARTFEILTPQATSLAHDSLGSSTHRAEGPPPTLKRYYIG